MVYNQLAQISPNFSIAAAFGNVHGVYSPGNVKLNPGILGEHQEYVREKLNLDEKFPIFFVMHGGSGSSPDEINEAVKNGTVKMNVDTDTQWAYWEGTKKYIEDKKEYLQSQIGNPEGPEKPNKNYYDPRQWLRQSEIFMAARIKESCRDLNNVQTNILPMPDTTKSTASAMPRPPRPQPGENVYKNFYRARTLNYAGKTLLEEVGPGVITGEKLNRVFDYAKEFGFAIPAVNVTCSTVANAVLEAAAQINSPIILQLSHGGGMFFAGKSVENTDERATIAGSIAAAKHIRTVAEYYGVPVILQTDHCAKKLLPWFEGLLDANEKHYAVHGEPLFSAHMLDLSEEPDEENIALCKKYLARMAKSDIWLEMEIGITGGEEDGVDNSDVDESKLYTTPEQILMVYNQLAQISPNFSIAAAFGNVHGVYSPGNVKLNPDILGEHQEYVKSMAGTPDDKPIYFVMHGGSGSTEEEIATAVKNGVIKMNVDTDTQWAFWEGTKDYVEKNKDYLKGQIGNPEGPEKPNKNYYDPRKWLRESEISMCNRVKVACENLGNVNTCNLSMLERASILEKN